MQGTTRYPILCMDCAQPSGETSTLEGSTGLCSPCLSVRERRIEQQRLRDALILQAAEDQKR